MNIQSKQTPPSKPPPETSRFVPHYQYNSFFRHPLITYLLIVLIIIAGLGAVMFMGERLKASNNGPVLALVPATKTLSVGETFSEGIIMNTNADTVSAVELHLSYDPTAIQILSFTPETPLPIVLVPETHANGTFSVTLGVQPDKPFKGAGIIGTLNLKILASKQSSLNFTSKTAVAALGKTTNALVSKTGTAIKGAAAVQ
ncbi:hypothetical protein HY338_03360, partial [Candidatus Gottesmanbacteria bacterium]|nr:hypothetical protein [Candidatus Gottesmanbacteria bacterium]